MSAEFLNEVDEHLRYERMTNLWNRYRFALFGLLALVFVALGAWEFFVSRQNHTQAERAKIYWEATNNTDKKAAIAALEPLTSGSDIYAVFAGFSLAQTKAETGDVAGAVAAYDAVIANRATPALYADLARIQTALMLLESDAAKADGILAALVQSQSVFAASALEYQGMIAENAGDKARAVSLYQKVLENPEAPAGLRQRAETRLGELDAARRAKP